MSEMSIIEKIKGKQLPLLNDDMEIVNTRIIQLKQTNKLVILNGIEPLFRFDWLNKQLDPIERATKNINVDSAVWRSVLKANVIS